IGVQAAAAPALARAWQSGEMREFPVGETLADGLAARVPAPEAVAVLRGVLDDMVEGREGAKAGAMSLRRRIAGERVGIVLSGGNITSSQLSKILHGELLPHAERGAFLAAQLADMEYGARGT